MNERMAEYAQALARQETLRWVKEITEEHRKRQAQRQQEEIRARECLAEYVRVRDLFAAVNGANEPPPAPHFPRPNWAQEALER